MSLFPQLFIEDLKSQTDILAVVGEVTPLRKAGASWKGLCPFHQEKTPSFNVNPDKGVFKCFGCGVGGDVIKFVELHGRLPFPEAVRLLATRAGLPVPDGDDGPADRAAAAEREALIRIHELAEAFYVEQLASTGGLRARRELESRELSAATIGTFRYGYAPARGDTLHVRFEQEAIGLDLQLRSGLVVRRDNGRIADRFRNRLIIPIARDTGTTVAFGGRALDEGQVPKYLNSPETPIYTKGRTLYGLHVTKGAVRTHNYCVLVEGYFDLAQVWQSGTQAVAALCGTALTAGQARVLRRLTPRVVLSLDADAAGQGAAARSSELLVAEGFQVNVALVPAGSDPDSFIRRAGSRAYRELLTGSVPYLDYLLDRASHGVDLRRPEHRKRFLDAMLTVAASIPDAAGRDQFADRLAHRAGITEGVIRDEIRRTAAQKKTRAPALAVAATTRLRPAESGLLWLLVHRPVEAISAISRLDDEDLEGLVSAPVLQLAATLADLPPESLPDLLRDRLRESERALLEGAGSSPAAPADPDDCVAALRRMRVERDRAAVQDEIDRLQHTSSDDDAALAVLWARKKELLRQLDDLS